MNSFLRLSLSAPLNPAPSPFLPIASTLALFIALCLPHHELAGQGEAKESNASKVTATIKREVLFSPGNVAERNNTYDRFETLKKSDRNPVLTAERPWESSGIGWGSVIRSRADGKYKFFYGASFPRPREGSLLIDNSQVGADECVVCYAESTDGITWTRPALDMHFKEQLPGNNIILTWASNFNDSSVVIEDTTADPKLRYKMLMYHHDAKDPDLRGGCLFVSPDGLRWEFTGTVLPSQDAQSLWRDRETGRYYAFLKDRYGNARSRMLTYSDDFKTWSEPQWIFTPDHGDHQGTNFYSQIAFPMAGRTLGFLSIYDLTTQTASIELIESGDKINWRRMPARPTILQAGGPGSYDGGGVYVGLAEPILIGDEYRYYYYATPDRHDTAAAGHRGEMKSSLAFATFRKNRLVGQQTEGEGYFFTLPFICPGGTLFLNFTSKDPVTVAIKRAGYGGEYPSYTFKDCAPVSGDDHDRQINWQTKTTLDDLKGKYIRIGIKGKNAVAYSASFKE